MAHRQLTRQEDIDEDVVMMDPPKAEGTEDRLPPEKKVYVMRPGAVREGKTGGPSTEPPGISSQPIVKMELNPREHLFNKRYVANPFQNVVKKEELALPTFAQSLKVEEGVVTSMAASDPSGGVGSSQGVSVSNPFTKSIGKGMQNILGVSAMPVALNRINAETKGQHFVTRPGLVISTTLPTPDIRREPGHQITNPVDKDVDDAVRDHSEPATGDNILGGRLSSGNSTRSVSSEPEIITKIAPARHTTRIYSSHGSHVSSSPVCPPTIDEQSSEATQRAADYFWLAPKDDDLVSPDLKSLPQTPVDEADQGDIGSHGNRLFCTPVDHVADVAQHDEPRFLERAEGPELSTKLFLPEELDDDRAEWRLIDQYYPHHYRTLMDHICGSSYFAFQLRRPIGTGHQIALAERLREYEHHHFPHSCGGKLAVYPSPLPPDYLSDRAEVDELFPPPSRFPWVREDPEASEAPRVAPLPPDFNMTAEEAIATAAASTRDALAETLATQATLATLYDMLKHDLTELGHYSTHYQEDEGARERDQGVAEEPEESESEDSSSADSDEYRPSK